MRKIWALVAVAVVVAVAGGIASRTASRQAQIAHAQSVQALASAEHVTVLSDTFKRGLMDSASEVHLEVAGPLGHWLRAQLKRAGLEHARSRFGLRLITRLEHGPDLAARWISEGAGGAPTVAIAVSELSLDGETARDLAAVLGDVPPATFVTEIGLSGQRSTSVVWAATQLTNATTGVTADWRGLDGLITHVPNGAIRGHVRGNGFGWSGPTGTFAVEGFEFDFDGQHDVDGVWSGKIDQRWRGVVWEPAPGPEAAPGASDAVPTELADATEDEDDANPEPGSVDLVAADVLSSAASGVWAADDLRITQEASRTGNEVDWRFDVRAAGGVAHGRPLQSLLGSLRLRHLDALAGLAGGDGENPLESLVASAAPHLARGPALDPFDVEVAGPDGLVKVSGSLRIDPDHPAAGHLISALDALTGQFVLTTEGSLGEAFGLTPDVVAGLQSAGLVALSGDAMVAPLALHGGKLEVARELVATNGDVTIEGVVPVADDAASIAMEEGAAPASTAKAAENRPQESPMTEAPAAVARGPEAVPPKPRSKEDSEDALMADLIKADDARAEAESPPAAPANP